ncbi:MAG: sulfide/dihydroorotate dehydrogenase-like FAD/NAD-binding protein [Candidatus Omnitrophota bacterium]|jgi:ferredoxin--NADP+ reductase|nr:MAG: sulfide/dihydroorotate dehydrogenase-like FAD/NAD-binding protein [Candidatus Omnitrophota bacterium]
MFKIIDKENLNKEIVRIEIEAPQIAAKANAGQFVAVVIDEKGERVPLTIADWDAEKGTITLIFQKVGFTTRKFGEMGVGQILFNVLGPLGHATRPIQSKTIICVAGGVGIAEIYPVIRLFKSEGNNVTTVIGARNKGLLILEERISKISDKLFITTDDGSYGDKGFVTDVLEKIINGQENAGRNIKPDLVYCVGPVMMMKAVSELTRKSGIKTIVSLNPIMVDATGMCGSCRCKVEGRTVFGCVDGPDFDGHQVDFDDLSNRLGQFKEEEKNAD